MHSREARRAREELARQIDAVSSGSFAPDNPIVEALKVVNLTESTDSNDQTLGLMLQKLDDLAGRMNGIERRLDQVAGAVYSSVPNSGLATTALLGLGAPNALLLREAIPTTASMANPLLAAIADRVTKPQKKGE
jgi:hypothetical protein